MYSLTRVIFLLIIVTAIVGYKKVRKREFHMKLHVVIPVLCVAFIALMFVTPETYLIGFNSPESAYTYECGGKYEALIQGEQSALTIKKSGDGATEDTLLLRKADRWYITTALIHHMEYATQYGGKYFIYCLWDDRITDVYYCIADVSYSTDQETKIIELNKSSALYELDDYSEGAQQLMKYRYYRLDKSQTFLTLTIDGKDVYSYDIEGDN